MLLDGSDTGLSKLVIRIALFEGRVYILYVLKIMWDLRFVLLIARLGISPDLPLLLHTMSILRFPVFHASPLLV
jgi:hypothetical protein